MIIFLWKSTLEHHSRKDEIVLEWKVSKVVESYARNITVEFFEILPFIYFAMKYFSYQLLSDPLIQVSKCIYVSLLLRSYHLDL